MLYSRDSKSVQKVFWSDESFYPVGGRKKTTDKGGVSVSSRKITLDIQPELQLITSMCLKSPIKFQA